MKRGGKARGAVLAVAALLLMRAAPAFAGYELGRGLSLLDDRLIVGGYLAADISFQEHSHDQLNVDDLSTFLTLHLSKSWLLFSEVELEDPFHLDSGGVDTGNNVFSLERLYVEWDAGDRFRIRTGQMLTPIGIWNVVHAQPLVWTTSRPIATEQFFDTGLTGVEASLFQPTRRADFTFTAFGQATDHIDDTNDAQQANRAIGSRIEAALSSGPRIGVSFVHFRDHVDRRSETTFGADAIWELRFLELSSELAVNSPDSGATSWGMYVQAVVHAPWNLHPFVRIEHADLSHVERTPLVFGFAWKPLEPVVFKLEGIVGGDDTSLGGDGILTSFSVLF